MTAKLVVLISGGGSNLQAIINAIAVGRLDVEIELVVSNRPNAFGLHRAQQAGIPTCVLPYKRRQQSRMAYDLQLAEVVGGVSADLIVLAGWMHILSAEFLAHFPQQIINLHPALPGQFPGTHAIERAFVAFEAGRIRESGCMVHYVIPEVDAGEVIAQRVVPFRVGDNLEQFEARMHSAEHQLIVDAIASCLTYAHTGKKVK